jgi:hypothetical protein
VKSAGMPREQRQVSIACGLVLLALVVIGLWRLQSELPGISLDVASERFPVLAGDSAWQQFAVPARQPTRLVIPFAQPMLTPGALSASYFVRDHADTWSASPVATIRTTLLPGQSEVRLPFPEALGAQRRLVRLKLTPESTAIAFKAARDPDRPLQFVTRRAGYLGIETLVFRAEYPTGQTMVGRALTPLACVTGVQVPSLPPGVLVGALLGLCAVGGWLGGLAWRLTAPN